MKLRSYCAYPGKSLFDGAQFSSTELDSCGRSLTGPGEMPGRCRIISGLCAERNSESLIVAPQKATHLGISRNVDSWHIHGGRAGEQQAIGKVCGCAGRAPGGNIALVSVPG